jgi:hypothetical protein
MGVGHLALSLGQQLLGRTDLGTEPPRGTVSYVPLWKITYLHKPHVFICDM